MKTITNKDVVVGKFLQNLITHLFGKGELYHFEWEDEGIAPNGCDRSGHCKASILVSFSLTHAIQLEVENFYFGDGQPYGKKGWTDHFGAGQFIKVSHKETGEEVGLTHWGCRGFAPLGKREKQFVQKLGLS
jgi:hypothetical protein